METQGQFLRRYTNLADAIHILKNRQMTLRDPRGWDDKNDAHFIEVYRTRTKAKSVQALCFTSSEETYHHWRIYAPGYDGVCFVLKHDAFVDGAKQSLPKLRAEFVRYEYMTDLRGQAIADADLPFLKRKAFSGENEFRFVYCERTKVGKGDKDNVPSRAVHLDIEAVDRISLSPWLHASLVPTLKETLRNVADVADLRVYQSKLIDYKSWRNIAGELAVPAD